MVENIPATSDPWEDEFCRQTFTPGEIAYCQMQENPRMHLAARWCAKEALKKCDAAFAQAKANTIELWSDGNSAPVLRVLEDGAARRLPHAVSISHTPETAVAMVVLVRRQAERPAAPAGQPASVTADDEVQSGGAVWVAVFGAVLIALGLSVWALIRTYLHG
jgi:phosphopantetheine--protein transferase-like protein